MKRQAQRGVALVTTLIMLSLITFTAVVFLAVTTRERNQVVVNKDTVTAQQIAESGFYRAQVEVVTPMIVQTNRFLYDLLVSVSQPFLTNGAPNVVNEAQQAYIASMRDDPRPPVYFSTNAAGPMELRFYLDFNRNRLFENTDLTNHIIGDPQWIGVLEHPDYAHSSSNKFVGRYAYLILPAGKSLDINFIHNYNKQIDPNMSPAFGDGFIRNEGIAPYEINLAALISQLNSNVWTYGYGTNSAANSGRAFNDAFSFLSYRYNTNYQNLDSAYGTLGAAGTNAIYNDNYDASGRGPFLTGLRLPTYDNDSPILHWAGAYNTNPIAQSIFDMQEVLNTNLYVGFNTNLNNASFSDPYVLYRLLSQLGSDSAVQLPGRINLNYDNVNNSLSQYANWTPINFFLEVGDRLMRSNYSLTIRDPLATNRLSIYPTNYYTSDVHRMLQLAANIFDATTNNPVTGYPYFPSVFRPVFTNSGTNISISGYLQVTDTTPLSNPYIEASNLLTMATGTYTNYNVYGVPWVVGAKKGFPNFNEFSVQTLVHASRRMEVRKQTTNAVGAAGNICETNLMYVMAVSNVFGVESWNSYTSTYPRALTLQVTNVCTIALTNESGVVIWPSSGIPQVSVFGTNMAISASAWTGKGFYLPIYTNIVFLTNSIYLFTNSGPRFISASSFPFAQQFQTNNSGQHYFEVPQWGLSISNQLQYALVETGATYSNVIDYVNVSGLNTPVNITSELSGGDALDMWNTNRVGGSTSTNVMTIGMNNQMQVSLGVTGVSQTDWRNYNETVQDMTRSITRFRQFMGGVYANGGGSPAYKNMQLPFTPSKLIYHSSSWQVNDPLVHYTLTDLTDYLTPSNSFKIVNNLPPRTPLSRYLALYSNLGKMNDRYSPWGGNPKVDVLGNPGLYPAMGLSPDYNPFNPAYLDPMMFSSDYWDFPTNKYGGLGWLGRVHRGTPWQTIYLKGMIPLETSPTLGWSRWSGNRFSNPTNDWNLVGMFTTALNDNATRSLLSINQANYAAWSAVLGGVLVLTNTTDYTFFPSYTPFSYIDTTIDPSSDQLTNIVDGINAYRAGLTNQNPTGVFTNLGQILAVPQLTVGMSNGVAISSPYLNGASLGNSNLFFGIPDVMMERIPQQVLSLLTLEDAPRIVIYAYGQTLHPAPASVVLSGANRGLVTNYEVTGEALIRAVVRFDGGPTNPHAVIEHYNILPTD